MSDTELSVPVHKLEAFIETCLLQVGLAANDAAIVASLMAEADLNGSDGHGIFRLPQYIDRIQNNGINTQPNIHIERETAASALVNGDNGMGHLVMHFAATVAMDKAQQNGIGWVGVHHSNHAGPASLYAKMPLARDMIGLYSAVGSANHLPPWGGTDMLLSTNPIAVAIPALTEPAIVLDMATTVAAYGKVKTKAQRGEMMPEGWMIDAEGKPLTDPQRANEGFLLPIGGAKGYGLALILGLLAGTLNGAAMGRDVVDFNADNKTITNTGQFIVAISIAAFADVEMFKQQVDLLIADLHNSATLPGFDAVRMPGERSYAERLQREQSGIPMHPNLIVTLDTLAQTLSVAALVRA